MPPRAARSNGLALRRRFAASSPRCDGCQSNGQNDLICQIAAITAITDLRCSFASSRYSRSSHALSY